MLKIKKEKFAEKCEICHKKDLFNPVNNSCGRCEKLIISRSDKGKFIVNWQVDLVLLANTLRNFAWQNLDIRSIKIVRLVLFISMLFLIFAPIADQEVQQYYQIASLPMPDGECQTEDFTMVCGRNYITTVADVQLVLLFTSVIGIFIGLVAYYSPGSHLPRAKAVGLFV